MSDEMLCKLYLELAHVVPESCKSHREVKLERELESVRSEEYNRAKSKFSSVTQAQTTLLIWFRHLRDNNLDELRTKFGSTGVELLEKALSEADG